MQKHKIFVQGIILFMVSVSLFGILASCSPTDKYHNKRHMDNIKKDMDSTHRDIDHVLGLDEPSNLVEEK
ncbi:MAG: hypothetical protein F9K48_06435 [Candidatus Brocadia sp.]|nr:MAG: hypothetical protein F9K48_06435 [Candidatus Brocadia sp.]